LLKVHWPRQGCRRSWRTVCWWCGCRWWWRCTGSASRWCNTDFTRDQLVVCAAAGHAAGDGVCAADAGDVVTAVGLAQGLAAHDRVARETLRVQVKRGRCLACACGACIAHALVFVAGVAFAQAHGRVALVASLCFSLAHVDCGPSGCWHQRGAQDACLAWQRGACVGPSCCRRFTARLRRRVGRRRSNCKLLLQGLTG
jgi:hypothetical protein